MDLFNNAAQYVLNTDIPSRILEDAFLPAKHTSQRNRSLTDCIIERIIKNKIMPDLNRIGGTIIDVPLYKCNYIYDDTIEYRYHRIYTIDPALTQNRPILAVLRGYNNGVLSAQSGYASITSGFSTYKTSDADTLMQKQIGSHTAPVRFSNSDVEIIGHNKLRIINTMMVGYNITLECRVPYSDQFHELSAPWHIEFNQLVNLATKAYIYKELRLAIDMFKLDGGRELGVYKDYVDNYSSAGDDYLEQIKSRWGKLLIMADPRRARKANFSAGRISV